ncbi:MAG: ATP-binding cassette domain-containing protein [Actinobacteria bacterium]|nr:ATP-binding cassette domain-containing protein [Actinomycetota bacterium]
MWAILTQKERRNLIWIFSLMLFGTVLETFSLGLVVPVVGLLTKSEYLKSHPRINELLNYPSQTQFVVGAMLLLVLVYVVKSIFLIGSLWVQYGYSTAVTKRLGRTLFENYLKQPFTFHLQRNSATLIRNSQNSASVMSGTIDPILSIAADALVTTGMMVLLLVIEPKGTIITILVFALSSFALRRFSSRRIRLWGEAQNFHKGKIIQHLQQGFGGVKDVKILGRENYFVTQYSDHLDGNANVLRRFSLAQAVPRFGLEILMMIGLASLVSTMVLSGQELTGILPVLGLFGASAFRLLPAVNRSILSAQTINLNRPLVDSVAADLGLSISTASMNNLHSHLASSISVQDLSFSYEMTATQALTEVSIDISRGEAVGLVGPSGSGKSTLVDILLGLLEPTSGRVLIDGSDIHDNLRGWQDQIGYVPQSIFLTDDTLRRNVAFGLPKDQIDDNALTSAIRSAQLEDFVASLPEGLDTIVGERGVRLSGGQRQRIGIARALYNNPDVLVLDEATSSLDTETEHGVMQAVQALQGKKTVIIVAHRLSTVEYCDRLYRLENARIVDEGTFSEVTSRTKDLPREN